MDVAVLGLGSRCSQNREAARNRMEFEGHSPLHWGFLCRTARLELLSRLWSADYLHGCCRAGPVDRRRFVRFDTRALGRALSNREYHVVRNYLETPNRLGHTALAEDWPEQIVRLGLFDHSVTNRYRQQNDCYFERWYGSLYGSIHCTAS